MKLLPLFLLAPFLVLIGCSSNTTNDPSTSVFSGTVEIGAGRKMYLECVGVGSPTVVLISGLGDRADIWHESDQPLEPSVFSETSTFTRVCAYDRPGTATYSEQLGVKQSRSDPIPQPTTARLAAMDLHQLLIASNQPGPYVLVGHSAGGLIARTYAGMYPEKVAGLVLVDALSEKLYQQMSPNDWTFFNEDLNGVPKEFAGYKDFERIDFVSSFEQLPFARLNGPIIILSAHIAPDFSKLEASGRPLSRMPPGFPDNLWRWQINAQNYLADLYPGAKHIWDTNSGHYVQVEQPQLVSQSIRNVVEEIRN